MLPTDGHVTLADVSGDTSLPVTLRQPGTHPVYFEFNTQDECVEKSFPIVKLSMLEFKTQVPFVNTAAVKSGTTMWKPIVYESNWVNVLATRAVYGLHTEHATMARNDPNSTMDPGSFNVTYEGSVMSASFEPYGPWKSPGTDGSFTPYMSINARPWLCEPVLSKGDKCAWDFYEWPNTLLRPVHMRFVIGEHMIPGVDKETIVTAELLTYEVKTVLHITGAGDCQ